MSSSFNTARCLRQLACNSHTEIWKKKKRREGELVLQWTGCIRWRMMLENVWMKPKRKKDLIYSLWRFLTLCKSRLAHASKDTSAWSFLNLGLSNWKIEWPDLFYPKSPWHWTGLSVADPASGFMWHQRKGLFLLCQMWSRALVSSQEEKPSAFCPLAEINSSHH